MFNIKENDGTKSNWIPLPPTPSSHFSQNKKRGVDASFSFSLGLYRLGDSPSLSRKSRFADFPSPRLQSLKDPPDAGLMWRVRILLLVLFCLLMVDVSMVLSSNARTNGRFDVGQSYQYTHCCKCDTYNGIWRKTGEKLVSGLWMKTAVSDDVASGRLPESYSNLAHTFSCIFSLCCVFQGIPCPGMIKWQ